MHDTSSQQLLSTREAAEHLRNSSRTFIRWRGLGLGPPYIRVGGKVRYLRRDLDEWLARHRVHPVREYMPAGGAGEAHQRAVLPRRSQ